MGRFTKEREIPAVIFDTDVLIWYFRGDPRARDLMTRVPYADRYTSSLCVMELVLGCLNKEELKTIREFLKENISSIVHPDEQVSKKSIQLLERHSLADGLRTVDALIAATTLQKQAVLATANYKHFRNITSLEILKFRN